MGITHRFKARTFDFKYKSVSCFTYRIIGEKQEEMQFPSVEGTTTVDKSSTLSFVYRHYLLLKVHYFFYFSGYGTMYPIMSITFLARGLSHTEIFYSNVIIPFLTFFTNPLIGLIADRFRRYLLTINVILCLMTYVNIIIFALPSMKSYPIRADMRQIDTMGRVLDFYASEETAINCALWSECGCAYQATCIPSMIHYSIDGKMNMFNFIFGMNSERTQKQFNNDQPMSWNELK